MRKPYRIWYPILLVSFATVTGNAQSFRVQCPTSTITHPSSLNNNNAEPPYNGPTTFATDPGGGQFLTPTANVNGAIKCQQISGGDGYSTMANGTQTFMFSFGPLSGLADIAAGLPGTEFPSVFNSLYSGVNPNLLPGDPATTDSAYNGSSTTNYAAFGFNGAVGLTPDVDAAAGGLCG